MGHCFGSTPQVLVRSVEGDAGGYHSIAQGRSSRGTGKRQGVARRRSTTSRGGSLGSVQQAMSFRRVSVFWTFWHLALSVLRMLFSGEFSRHRVAIYLQTVMASPMWTMCPQA